MSGDSKDAEIGCWAWRLLPLFLCVVAFVYLKFSPNLSEAFLEAGIASQADDWWIVKEFTGKPL